MISEADFLCSSHWVGTVLKSQATLQSISDNWISILNDFIDLKLFLITLLSPRGRIVVRALWYKPEGRRFGTG
jgi:hypothetical protein